MSYSLEKMFQIWNDRTGERIEIGPDRDGLDLIEIRFYAVDSKQPTFIIFNQEQVPLLIQALRGLTGAE